MVPTVLVCKLTKETRWVCIPTFRYLSYLYLFRCRKKDNGLNLLFTVNRGYSVEIIINLHSALPHKAIIPVSSSYDKEVEVKSNALLSCVGRQTASVPLLLTLNSDSSCQLLVVMQNHVGNSKTINRRLSCTQLGRGRVASDWMGMLG